MENTLGSLKISHWQDNHHSERHFFPKLEVVVLMQRALERKGRSNRDSGQVPFRHLYAEHTEIALAGDTSSVRTGESKLTRLPTAPFSPIGQAASTKEEISRWQTKATKITD